MKIAAAAALSVILAGCGSGGGETQRDADGNQQVVVGTSPTISNVTLYYGMSEGLFGAAGLAVQPQAVTSGQQAVPLLLNGQLQFTAADPLGAMVAISKGTPLTVVGGTNYSPADADLDTSAVVVPKDSAIQSAAELPGRSVAVNSLRSLSELSTRAAIRKAGVDDSEVKFTEIPIPQMLASVEQGTVDAAVVNEPQTSEALTAGFRRVLSPMSSALAGTPQLVYIASKSFAAENPEVVDAFAGTLAQSNEAMAKNPDLVRSVAATSTATPPEVLDVIKLPIFEPQVLEAGSLAALQKLLLEEGYIASDIDLDSVVWQRKS